MSLVSNLSTYRLVDEQTCTKIRVRGKQGLTRKNDRQGYYLVKTEAGIVLIR